MNFNVRMGIPEMQELWLDLQEKYRSGNIKKKEEQLYKKWGKALKLLSADPGYPSLQTLSLFEEGLYMAQTRKDLRIRFLRKGESQRCSDIR